MNFSMMRCVQSSDKLVGAQAQCTLFRTGVMVIVSCRNGAPLAPLWPCQSRCQCVNDRNLLSQDDSDAAAQHKTLVASAWG